MRPFKDTVLLLCFILLVTSPVFADNPEIHCKHFFYGYPAGTPETNDLIIRDTYALSNNDETKFADWVAYRLTPHEVMGTLDLFREWHSDPWLDESETLEGEAAIDDYEGAYSALGYDRGHQAPLASFKGTKYASQVNFMSNITPQHEDLNRGTWKELEGKVRDLVMEYGTVWVMTGPLYQTDMDELPNADDDHVVPSGYWKVVAVQTGSSSDTIQTAAFMMEQATPRGDRIIDHVTTIHEIEEFTDLDLLWELPDNVEQEIEQRGLTEWAEVHF